MDDQPMLAEMLGFALVAAGFRVRACDNPKVALQAFLDASPRPDVLVSDNMMPEMNGWELIKLCKEAHPRLKTVSASGSLHKTPPPADVSLDGIIQKPFSPAELVVLVKQILAK
ncbi:MAG: response regulator [Verrucomicrobia bacterium]|nr:response regulator [Verrucomicrobiota bacterium]